MKSDVLNYKLINNVLNEFLDEHTRQVLTEDQQRTIRNKIARGVAATAKMDIASQEVQNAVDEIWKTYVAHPIEGEKRQNDEITVINQNIERLIPYVVSVSEYDNSISVNKSLRLRKSFEELIQAQRQNRQTQLWQNNQSLTHWSTKKRYDDASKKYEEETEGKYHYTVYRIEDYDTPIEGLGMTVTELGNYTGGQGAVPLCYTQTLDTYNSYTEDNRFTMYALLRDGWQDEPCEIGDGYPLDSYGLSMIFVIISPTKKLVNSNVRWNHGPNKYSRKVDNIFSYAELREIVGSNVIKQIGYKQQQDDSLQLTYEVEEKLRQNIDVSDIFDIVNPRVHCGFRGVELNDKYNYIDGNNNLLSDEWFDDGYNFGKGGYARVQKGDKWNFLRTDGTFVWNKPEDEWFDDVESFEDDGLALVENNCLYNYLKQDGTLVYNADPSEWFNEMDVFVDGFANVRRGRHWNILSLEGRLMYPYGFDGIASYKEGIAIVTRDYMYNYVRRNGTLVYNVRNPDEWFNAASGFKNGIGVVGKLTDGSVMKYNLITKDGKLVWNHDNPEEWFGRVLRNGEDYGIYVVNNGDYYNILNLDGTLKLEKGVLWDELCSITQQMVRDIKKQRLSIQESLNKYLSKNLLKIRY